MDDLRIDFQAPVHTRCLDVDKTLDQNLDL